MKGGTHYQGSSQMLVIYEKHQVLQQKDTGKMQEPKSFECKYTTHLPTMITKDSLLCLLKARKESDLLREL